MIITGISPWKKDRQLITLDHESAFVLYDSEVRKYALKEGEDIDSAKYADILDNVLVKRAKSRTLHLLDRFDKTERELRDKLREDMYPGEAIDAAVEAAKKGRFLDDRRFTAQYIRDKSARHSLKRIEADLRRKGIDREILSEALREFEEDQAENGEDREEELILKLIEKRCPDPAAIDHEAEQKLLYYLSGKGFEPGKCRKLVERYRDALS